MIIINLKGGLGNQMFQYACGRAISLRNEEKIKLDITGFERTKNMDTPREYYLSHFNIFCNEIASGGEIQILKYPLGIVSKGWRFFKVKILRQFNIGFIPKIFNAKKSIYLDGFFQTEKYFIHCADTIRKEFSLKEPMGQAAQAVASKISKEPESVSLHVRRGDVARNVATNPYAGITTPEYYRKALEYIGSKLKKPHVFIFSDDPKWVVENIKISFPSTVISSSGIPDYEEIILMSQCRAHIIANSSFSWWGAWLNPRPDKIVIAPKQWIRKMQWRHKDTVPKSWIRL